MTKEEALEKELCDDCVSRQEAILQVQRYGVGCFDAEEFSPEQCERFVIQKLNELPSVMPKEKTGKWDKEDGCKGACEGYMSAGVVCSQCGEVFCGYIGDYNFCPNCGRRMISK